MVSIAALCAALSVLYRPLGFGQVSNGFPSVNVCTYPTTSDGNRTANVDIAIPHGYHNCDLTSTSHGNKSGRARDDDARASACSYDTTPRSGCVSTSFSSTSSRNGTPVSTLASNSLTHAHGTYEAEPQAQHFADAFASHLSLSLSRPNGALVPRACDTYNRTARCINVHKRTYLTTHQVAQATRWRAHCKLQCNKLTL